MNPVCWPALPFEREEKTYPPTAFEWNIPISFHLCYTFSPAHAAFITRRIGPSSLLPFVQAWSPQAVHTRVVSVSAFLRCCMYRDTRRLPDAVYFGSSCSLLPAAPHSTPIQRTLPPAPARPQPVSTLPTLPVLGTHKTAPTVPIDDLMVAGLRPPDSPPPLQGTNSISIHTAPSRRQHPTSASYTV